ncbi:MAG: hypothetical protein KO464_11095 [Candidatus Methanofastidiosum sp.]|nr:hypothetical protein [Methanofastidiosum sp.]
MPVDIEWAKASDTVGQEFDANYIPGTTDWHWFATEVSEIRLVGDETGCSVINGNPENDIIYYDLVLGPTEEWGYFSARELEMGERVEKYFNFLLKHTFAFQLLLKDRAISFNNPRYKNLFSRIIK